ncbi:MAG: hypothetical protein WHS87_03495 [Anaerolineales bacterium]
MMSHRSRTWYALLVFPILLALACIPFGLFGPGDDSNAQGPAERFTATVTSPVSVLVKWPAASGATKYIVEVKYGDLDFFPLAEVPGDQTSYEDFPAPDNTALTYRLQVVTASGTSEGGMASVTTPAQEPNPLTVQAHEYEPVAWEPPALDPNDPNFDPTKLFPPGFDPNNPDAFDPSSLMVVPSATSVIGPAGGTLSVTSPDEVTFTLIVPAGALDAEMPITLTPIQSIDGLPLSGGLLGAVRIEPEGLLLDMPALLQISLPGDRTVPDGNLALGFAFEEEGREFHLYPLASRAETANTHQGAVHMARLVARPLLAGPLAEIAAKQLKSYGVGAGTKADVRSIVRDHRPTSNQNAHANRTAAANDELAPLVVLPSVKSANNVNKNAQNARSWDEVVEVLDQFEFHIQQYGDKGIKDINDKIWDRLLDQIYKLLNQYSKKCIQAKTREDFSAQAMAQRLSNPRRGSFGEQMAKRFKQKYGDQVLRDIAAGGKCQYTLTIKSQIEAVFPEESYLVRYVVPISGSVDLRWTLRDGKPYLTGKGSMNYGVFNVFSHDLKCTPIKYDHPNKADMVVIALEPVFDESGGAVTDFVLSDFVVVDAPGGKFETTCTAPKTGETVTLRVPMLKGKSVWYGFYAAAHPGDMEVKDWKMLTDGGATGVYIITGAEKVYDRPSFAPPIAGSWGNWSEKSVFKLQIQSTP